MARSSSGPRGDLHGLTVSVDFDGTICDHLFPECGPLKPGAKEAITRLYTLGARIIISSCRNNPLLARGDPELREEYVSTMRRYLDEHDIPYTRIDTGNEGKVLADFYIDDKGIRYEDNWPQILEWFVQQVAGLS